LCEGQSQSKAFLRQKPTPESEAVVGMCYRHYAIFISLLFFAFTAGSTGTAAVKTMNRPSGVLYFSNGASIQKLNLESRELETITPHRDDEGNLVNSTWPVFSSKRKKMYFFRSYKWPQKEHLAVFDLIQKKVERTLDFYGECLSLSPDQNTFAYFKSKRIDHPQTSHRLELLIQLVVRALASDREEILANDVCFGCGYTSPPIWLSNEEIIYYNTDREIVQINIHSKVKEKWPRKEVFPLMPIALSPDRTKLLASSSNLSRSRIYLIDIESKAVELLMTSSWLIRDNFIWSPDRKSLIYTRFSWSNKLPFNEVGNLYWWDIETKKEVKIANTVELFGGFWLEE
jgi:hypothetical protein